MDERKLAKRIQVNQIDRRDVERRRLLSKLRERVGRSVPRKPCGKSSLHCRLVSRQRSVCEFDFAQASAADIWSVFRSVRCERGPQRAMGPCDALVLTA